MKKHTIFFLIFVLITIVSTTGQEAITIDPDGTIKVLINGNLEVLEQYLNPVGSIQPFAGVTSPDGWLICDGREVDRTQYDILFSVIGESFGSGDGLSTFNIPDLRGQFIRGLDNPGTAEGTADLDPDSTTRTLGSSQTDAFQGHWHNMVELGDYASSDSSGPASFTYSPKSNPVQLFEYFGAGAPATAGEGNYGSVRIASETRSTNLAINFIIKF